MKVNKTYLLTIYANFGILNTLICDKLREQEKWVEGLEYEKKMNEEALECMLKEKINETSQIVDNFKNSLTYDKKEITNTAIDMLSHNAISEIQETHLKLLSALREREKKVRNWNDIIDEKTEGVRNQIEERYNEILKRIDEKQDEFYEKFEYDELKLIEKLKEKNVMTCRTCGHGSKDKNNLEIISCFYKYYNWELDYGQNREPEYSCKHWRKDKVWGRKK